MSTVKVGLELDSSVEAIIIRHDHKRIIPYIMCGNGNYTKQMRERGVEAMSLIDVLLDLSKPEKELFKVFKRLLPWDVETTVIKTSNASLSKREKRLLKDYYKSLYEKKILARISRGKYMINPSLIIPQKEASCISEWESLRSVPTKNTTIQKVVAKPSEITDTAPTIDEMRKWVITNGYDTDEVEYMDDEEIVELYNEEKGEQQ